MRNATVLKLVACGCKSRLGSQVPRHRPMTRKRLLCYFREWQLPGPVNPGVQGWRYTLDKVRQTAGESPAPATVAPDFRDSRGHDTSGRRSARSSFP